MLRLNGQFNINASVVRGDKSVSHRALIFASIASGQSVIRNITLSDDVLATVDCLRALGATITIDGNVATVSPISNPVQNAVLDCKNSGTTVRLLAGLVAGLGICAKFVGDSSLINRPMDRVLKPLIQLGASFFKIDDGLFESLGGKLHGEKIVAEVNSAQVKSAVLIAGLFADGETTYVEQLPTRNHTELMLEHMGASISVKGLSSTVARSALNPLDIDVPRDVSSLAFLIALSLASGNEFTCDNVLLNERRTGFLRVLKRSGANIVYTNVRNAFGEKVGDITVKNNCLKPLFADMRDVCDAIDELPILAVTALTVKGKHVFNNVSELRHKESDRIDAILHMARICNQHAELDGENLIVISDGKLPKNPRFYSFDDHRVAMAEVVLCLLANGGSVDKTPFDVSFPEFTQALGLNIFKLGLIGGSNITNSRSPLLMEYLATQANVACSYDLSPLPDTVSDEDLLAVISKYRGLNVTMPFKRRVASLLCSKVESVNTVGKSVLPQTTDGYGIVMALEGVGVDFVSKPLWIVGAGGAATVCVQILSKYGCQMQILNRTQAHADELTAKYNLSTDITEPYGVLSFVPESDFEQKLVLPSSCKFVFVAAYKGQSGLKRQAIERGITYVDGLRMLYHQGAMSFALWTDTAIQSDYDGFERFSECLKRNA